MDLVTTSVGAVSAVNTAMTLADRIAKLVKLGSKLEAQEAILELRKALLSLGQENLSLGNENLELKQEISRLRSETSNEQSLQFAPPNYYVVDTSGKKDGPFCQVCKDADDKLIRTQEQSDGHWKCPVCKNHALTPEAKARIAAESKQSRRVVSSGVVNRDPLSWMGR